MANNRPTRAWYLIPFFLGILGGIIGYFAVKNDDKEMANNLLVEGIIMTVIAVILWFIFIVAWTLG
jgi:CHASE2 domain-containing sensor protein